MTYKIFLVKISHTDNFIIQEYCAYAA